ncbi:MAG TPA: hypothetical protein PKK48_05620 [Phycisphaerae bacterium]|nr:hypothetical protein [Phycisphaerae bacterium]HPS52727.1 hypothetical protein [Phycisphaerae bacterium]
MFYAIWNILILSVGCFVCTAAGAAVFRRLTGDEFLKKNFDRVETLCAEFLCGTGILGTAWLILAILPGGGWLGRLIVMLACIVAVMLGGRSAAKDVNLAWRHIKIIVTHPYRESDISVKILHWLILAGLAAMLVASFFPPDNYETAGKFLVAKTAACYGGITGGAAGGVELFAAGGMLAEMNIAALMLFGGAMAAGVVGFIYLLAGMMLASGIGRRAGLNYLDRWLLVLVLTAWGVAVSRCGNFDAYASGGLVIVALVTLSVADGSRRGVHILAGLMIAWAIMMQYMQAVVILPATAAFAFSLFSRQRQNQANNADEANLQPTVMRRMGWLFSPVGAMLILWLLKNIAVYGSLLPVQPDNPFNAATMLSVATLPLMLLLVIFLRWSAGRKMWIGKIDCGRAISFLWQLLAFIIVWIGIGDMTSLNRNIFAAMNPSGEKGTDFICMNDNADATKDRVFTLSPYIYFMDERFLKSSAHRELLRELCDKDDTEKWRELWAKNFRLFYLTNENTVFSRDGKEFRFSVILDDGRVFTLDSAKLPPELGLERLVVNGSGKSCTSCGYKLVIRENAIIPDGISTIEN